jgi:hypothetical protein
MGPVIGTVKAQAERMIEILESQVESLRVGGVAFRTRDDDEMPMPVFQDLTADRKKLVAWIRTLKAKAGGEEAVGDGLEAAIHEMSWSPKARKVIVLIGDEGPVGGQGERLLNLARAAKTKGIIVHTITQSDTAWLYYMNWIRNVDPEGAQAIVRLYGTIDDLKRSFRLPMFEQVAEAGGGRAVGTGDTREIVKWLLAFALGYQDDDSPPDVPPPTAATQGPSRPKRPPHTGRARIGWVRYAGEWKTPRSFDGLMRHLGSLMRIDLDEKPQVVRLSDQELWRHPILYLSGHGPVRLTRAERRGLVAYAASGGMLWADNCCAKKLFDTTLREELSRAFGRKTLRRLPVSHPLFDVGHVIDTMRCTAAHRTLPYRNARPHVEALNLDGREVVLYTPRSLGAGWKTYDHGMPCMVHDDDALKLSENIVLYALSR